jgi:hypothetical protein
MSRAPSCRPPPGSSELSPPVEPPVFDCGCKLPIGADPLTPPRARFAV